MSEHLIEQKIASPIVYNIFHFSLSGFVSRNTPDKIQQVKNLNLHKKGPKIFKYFFTEI